MKTNILPAIKLTIVTILFFAVVYPCAIWAVAQLYPGRGKGRTIEYDGRKFYGNIGQPFTDDKYFQPRPSATGYNAAGSAGSNKGPTNAEYLAQVQARIDTFLVHNPGIDRSQVPVEMVTASGSGIDPDISVKAAQVQVKRIARVRNLPEDELYRLVGLHTKSGLAGMLGPDRINVLELNIALDKMNN